MRRCLVGLAALAALLAPAAAFAGPSAPTRTEINLTRTIDTCGFPVVVTFTGYEIDHFLTAGNKVLFIANFPQLKTTVTNPANGISLSTPSPSQEFTVVYPDGTFTSAVNGLTVLWVEPGEGLLGGLAGRFSATYYLDGTTTIQVAGITVDGSVFQPACSALAG